MGRAPLCLGIRSAPADDGEKAGRPQRLGAGDGEQGRVHAPGVAEDGAPETAQVPSQEVEVCHDEET
jgi:hypothetical protein